MDCSVNTSNLCRRCRRLTTERQDIEAGESCEECKRDPELDHITKQAALSLSKLAATLTSGISSDQRAAIGIIGVSFSWVMQPLQVLAIRRWVPELISTRCPWVGL
jgi:hypothetical protein